MRNAIIFIFQAYIFVCFFNFLHLQWNIISTLKWKDLKLSWSNRKLLGYMYIYVIYLFNLGTSFFIKSHIYDWIDYALHHKVIHKIHLWYLMIGHFWSLKYKEQKLYFIWNLNSTWHFIYILLSLIRYFLPNTKKHNFLIKKHTFED